MQVTAVLALERLLVQRERHGDHLASFRLVVNTFLRKCVTSVTMGAANAERCAHDVHDFAHLIGRHIVQHGRVLERIPAREPGLCPQVYEQAINATKDKEYRIIGNCEKVGSSLIGSLKVEPMRRDAIIHAHVLARYRGGVRTF